MGIENESYIQLSIRRFEWERGREGIIARKFFPREDLWYEKEKEDELSEDIWLFMRYSSSIRQLIMNELTDSTLPIIIRYFIIMEYECNSDGSDGSN